MKKKEFRTKYCEPLKSMTEENVRSRRVASATLPDGTFRDFRATKSANHNFRTVFDEL